MSSTYHIQYDVRSVTKKKASPRGVASHAPVLCNGKYSDHLDYDVCTPCRTPNPDPNPMVKYACRRSGVHGSYATLGGTQFSRHIIRTRYLIRMYSSIHRTLGVIQHAASRSICHNTSRTISRISSSRGYVDRRRATCWCCSDAIPTSSRSSSSRTVHRRNAAVLKDNRCLVLPLVSGVLNTYTHTISIGL